jgi:hypothetical protein
MRKMRRFVLGLLAGCVAIGSVTAAQAAEGKIKGYMFGDYYYKVSGPAEKRNAFEIRRIYFTYDMKWDERFSGRLRTEAKDAGFGSGSTMGPVVKDAYLKYKMGKRAIEVGLSPTPTWNITEGIWGYRPIEKTIMDLNKVGSSRDQGIAYRGVLAGDGALAFQLMLGNGASNKSEKDNDKKLYGQLHFETDSKVQGIAYADWQSQPGGKDVTTVAAVLGKGGKAFHGGVEAFWQQSKKKAAGADVTSLGVSVFAAKKIKDGTKAFARADMFEPNDDVDDDRSYLLVGGVDFEAAKGLHFMPNLRVMLSDVPGVDTDVTPRVTGYFKF